MKPSPKRFPKNLWYSCTIGSSSQSSAASTISHSLVAASQLQQGCSEVELCQKSICIDGTHSYITLKNVEQSCIPATCESGFSKHFHKILQKRSESLFVYHCTTHLYNVMHPANFALLSFSHFPIHSFKSGIGNLQECNNRVVLSIQHPSRPELKLYTVGFFSREAVVLQNSKEMC